MWLPDVERVHGNSGGSMDGTGGATLLLHSTEGSTIEGAIGAYRTHNSWPTLTVDCPDRRAVEHLPLDVAARALRNAAGGVQTNREGPVLVQVELVGFAGQPSSIGDADDLDWFGREIVAPIAKATGIPLRSTVTWVAYPASYGLNARQRLSNTAWVSYAGILGHQHAPENTHGDPGALNVGRIIAAATGSSTSTGDWFDMATASDLRRIVREELDHAKTARPAKTYGRDWMQANLDGIVRTVVREELDHAKTARPAKTYGRDYIKQAVEPELAAIKAAVTTTNGG